MQSIRIREIVDAENESLSVADSVGGDDLMNLKRQTLFIIPLTHQTE